MSSHSYARHRFPPSIIQRAVWLYFRFSLSYRDVEDLLAVRGIDFSYETVRRWALKFGRTYAMRIRRRLPGSSSRWHLDEVFIRIGGHIHYLWRAVDDEGEALEILVQSRRDRKAALKLLRRLLKRQRCAADAIVTDRLRSYGAALCELGLKDRHVVGGGRTIGRKSRTNRHDSGKDSAADFERQDRPSNSSRLTPPSTTSSASNAT